MSTKDGALALYFCDSLIIVEKQACSPETGALRGKSNGPGISDFGLRIADFVDFLLQSAFRSLAARPAQKR
jgi:hypothetical protein